MKEFFTKIHNFFKHIFTETKFGKFWIKAHLQYLALAGLLYGVKAGLYFIIAYIPSNPIEFHMAIDDQIPFISYFYFFYCLYYVVPEILLWILSFYDKKKMFTIIAAAMSANIIACICFLIQQVHMVRPDLSMYEDFSSVTNLDTFFKWAVNKQYHADATALNCFPSLHASMGMAVVVIGIPFFKKDGHFPLGLRIFSIIFGFGVVMSTFFIKQHYFIDAVAGALLLLAMYFIWKFLFDYLIHKKELKKSEQSEPVSEVESK